MRWKAMKKIDGPAEVSTHIPLQKIAQPPDTTMSWLTATRCLRGKRLPSLTATRTMYSAPGSSSQQNIESPEDWILMQENRARFKSLGEYVRVFTRFLMTSAMQLT